MSGKANPHGFKGEPIGKNMAAALKGDQNDRGNISSNYQGRCKNAIPGYKGDGGICPQDFAQAKMQAGRAHNK